SFFYKFLICLSYWCKHPVVVKFRTAVHTGYYGTFSANSERHSTFTVRALEKLVFIRPAIRSRIIFPYITYNRILTAHHYITVVADRKSSGAVTCYIVCIAVIVSIDRIQLIPVATIKGIKVIRELVVVCTTTYISFVTDNKGECIHTLRFKLRWHDGPCLGRWIETIEIA